MDQQRHADFSHGFDRRQDLVDTGHAGVGVGGRARRVQLGGVHKTAGLGLADFGRLGTVGEVEHHQRFEAAAGRARSEDTLAIGIGLLGITHRRYQVRHDNRAAKRARYIGHGLG